MVTIHHDSIMLLSAEFTEDYVEFLKGGPNRSIDVHCSRPFRLRDIDGRRDAAVLVLALLKYMETEVRLKKEEGKEEEDEEAEEDEKEAELVEEEGAENESEVEEEVGEWEEGEEEEEVDGPERDSERKNWKRGKEGKRQGEKN